MPQYINNTSIGGVRRGKLVIFYKNGDQHFRGLQTSVSSKHFITMETLLKWLDEKIPMEGGVGKIFKLPSGYQVTEIFQFISGCSYVASSNNQKFLFMNYGGKNKTWNNKPGDCDDIHSSPSLNLKDDEEEEKGRLSLPPISYNNKITSVSNRDQSPLAPSLVPSQASSLVPALAPPPHYSNYGNTRSIDESTNTSPEVFPRKKTFLPLEKKKNETIDYSEKPTNETGSEEKLTPSPRIITLISNMNRSRKQKCIFNPNSRLNY